MQIDGFGSKSHLQTWNAGVCCRWEMCWMEHCGSHAAYWRMKGRSASATTTTSRLLPLALTWPRHQTWPSAALTAAKSRLWVKNQSISGAFFLPGVVSLLSWRGSAAAVLVASVATTGILSPGPTTSTEASLCSTSPCHHWQDVWLAGPCIAKPQWMKIMKIKSWFHSALAEKMISHFYCHEEMKSLLSWLSHSSRMKKK